MVAALRKKYPKWAHRQDHRKKRAGRKRRKRKSRKHAPETEHMLVSLLSQLMLGGTLAKKHGENVLTGVAGKVKPNYLSPLWSQHERNFIMERGRAGMRYPRGAGGAAAAVVGAPAGMMAAGVN
jgi:hypothetical protein